MSYYDQKTIFQGTILSISAPFNLSNSVAGFADARSESPLTVMVVIQDRSFLSRRILKFFLIDDDFDKRPEFFKIFAQLLLSKPGDQVEIVADLEAPLKFGGRIKKFWNPNTDEKGEIE